MYEHYFQATLAPDLPRRIRDALFPIPTRTAAVQGEVALRFPDLLLQYAKLYHKLWRMAFLSFPVHYSAISYRRSRCIPSCIQRHYAVSSIPQLERKGFQQIMCIRKHLCGSASSSCQENSASLNCMFWSMLSRRPTI